jgi:hypothetical protein
MQIRALPNEARYALPQVGRHPSEREVAIPSERVVVISRNDWSSSIGIDGRHQPVRAFDRRAARGGAPSVSEAAPDLRQTHT